MERRLARPWQSRVGWVACLAGGLVLSPALAAKSKETGKVKPMVKMETATFAGGCFWCMEPPFEQLEGVSSVRSGYTGGTKKHPIYQEVCQGTTGHAEAVEIVFDPATITYTQLLSVFWRNIDPTAVKRQFVDVGSQYRTAVFYHSPDQQLAALASKEKLEKSGKFTKPIVTEIVPAGVFYPAEDYHQDYYKKNPEHYESYKEGSGRPGFLQRLWGGK